MGEYVMHLLATFIYQGGVSIPRVWSSRILLQFYLFFVIIFVCVLYADIKTSLTIITPSVFRGLGDVTADDNVQIILVERGSSLLSVTIKNAYPEFWKKVNSPPNKVHSQMPFVDELRFYATSIADNKMVGIGEASAIQMLCNAVCIIYPTFTLALSRERIVGNVYAFLIGKHIPLDVKKEVEKMFTRAIEVGLISFWRSNILEGGYPPCATDNFDTVTKETDMFLLVCLTKTFIIWALGLLVSTICFVAEIIINTLHCARKETKE